MKLPSNIPFVSLIPRIGWVLLFLVVTNWMCLSEIHFSFLGKWAWDSQLGGFWRDATMLEFCGPLLWAAPFFAVVIVIIMAMLHLIFRETIDADLNNGNFVAWWKGAVVELKLKLIFFMIGILILGACILLSPLARA